MEPIFTNDEEAQAINQGGQLMAFIDERVSDLGSYGHTVEKFLKFNANERKSASIVLEKEPLFRSGAYTQMAESKQQNEVILAGLTRLASSVQATQRMIVEYGDTTVPRVVMLVPDDLAKRKSNHNKIVPVDFFYRLASDAGVIKRYNLFFVCEGCTLFPSTACSCGNVLNNPVRVDMPGATLKKLAPALKAAAVLYSVASAASNVAGVKLPLELPGVNDVVDFAKAVNSFVETSDELDGSGTRVYGEAYTELAKLLERSGVEVKSNTCQGLLKVTDQVDGKVYWVCKAHAEAHAGRLFNASTAHLDQAGGSLHRAMPNEAEAAALSTINIANLLESAKETVLFQENKVSKLWTEGNFAAAARHASELVDALENLAEISNDMAQVAAKTATLSKEAAAKGFQGKRRGELNDTQGVKFCQANCGNTVSSISCFRKVKHTCKGCGQVVCVECSPPPKVKVLGYADPQRICKKCVEAVVLREKEVDEAAAEAAKQSAVARKNSQRAKADKMGSGPHLDVDGAAIFLEKALGVALAKSDLDGAASLKRKLEKVRGFAKRRTEIQDEHTKAYEVKNLLRRKELDAELKAAPVVTLFVAIALDAFPIGTIVSASVRSESVAAGTAGEVVGHNPNGEVEVRFMEGESTFEVGSLHVTHLPNGWVVNQTCFHIVDLPGEVSAGQPGRVLGWSKPFDREKILSDFGGRQLNVLVSQIQKAEQFKTSNNNRTQRNRVSTPPPIRVVKALPSNDEAQRILFAKLPVRVQSIIGKGLANRSTNLSEDDSLAVLTSCIDIGVERAGLALKKTAVVVVGNTGAGKSTFVNYILKCAMEKVLIQGKKKPVYIVSEKSPVKEVMSIGHTKVSHSFVPELAEAKSMNAVVVDCPGFLDNRGAEISIANAANIKAVMARADGVSLVAVLNYYSLKADRGRGVRELLETLLGLFGSIDRAIIHAKSILLVVSHAPEYTDDGRVELVDVKDEFDASGLSSNMANLLDALLDRACIFHPENKGGESWLTAGPLSERIKTSPPISNPAEVFKIVLSVTDEGKLRTLVEALFRKLKLAMESGNYEASAKALSDMKRLDIIDHVAVTRLLDSAKNRVNQALLNLTFEAQTCVLLDKLDDAAALLTDFRAILKPFSAVPAAKGMLDLVELTSRADAVEKAADSRREEQIRREQQNHEAKEFASTVDALKRDLAVAEAQQREARKTEEGLKSELARFKANAEKETERVQAQDKAQLEALEEKLMSASAEEKKKLEVFRTELENKFKAELRERQENESKQAALLSRLLEEQEKSRREREEAEHGMRAAIAKAEAEKAAAEAKAIEEAQIVKEMRAKAEKERLTAEEAKKDEDARRQAEAKRAEEEQMAREAEEARRAEEIRLIGKAKREAEVKAKAEREAAEKAKREAEEAKAKRKAEANAKQKKLQADP